MVEELTADNCRYCVVEGVYYDEVIPVPKLGEESELAAAKRIFHRLHPGIRGTILHVTRIIDKAEQEAIDRGTTEV